MVSIDVEYKGDLRCEAQHGPSNSKILTDAPTDNHGKGEAFSPTDLVATSLATCVMTILGIVAAKHSVDLAGSRVNVEKHMSNDAPRRIARLPVKVEIRGDVDEVMRQKLEMAALACPVHKSLHPDIDAPITFNYVSKS